MPMMTSQNLNSVDLTKTQKSREQNIFSSNKKKSLQQNCVIKNMPPEVLSFVRKFHSLTKFIHEEKCGTVTK